MTNKKRWKTFIPATFVYGGLFLASVSAGVPAHAESPTWTVSKISAQRSGDIPYCTLASQFDSDNLVMAFARNADGENSIALNFTAGGLSGDKSYNIRMKASEGAEKSFLVQPVSSSAFVIRLGQEEKLLSSLKASEALMLGLDDKSYDLSFEGFTDGFNDLQGCATSLNAKVASQSNAASWEETTAAQEDAEAAALENGVAEKQSKADREFYKGLREDIRELRIELAEVQDENEWLVERLNKSLDLSPDKESETYQTIKSQMPTLEEAVRESGYRGDPDRDHEYPDHALESHQIELQEKLAIIEKVNKELYRMLSKLGEGKREKMFVEATTEAPPKIPQVAVAPEPPVRAPDPAMRSGVPAYIPPSPQPGYMPSGVPVNDMAARNRQLWEELRIHENRLFGDSQTEYVISQNKAPLLKEVTPSQPRLAAGDATTSAWLTSRVDHLENKVQELEGVNRELQSELDDARRKLSVIKSAENGNQDEIQIYKDKLADINERYTQLQAERDSLISQLDALKSERAAEVRQMEQMQARLKELQTKEQEIVETDSAPQPLVSSADDQTIDDLKTRLMTMQEEHDRMSGELVDLKTEREKEAARVAMLQDKLRSYETQGVELSEEKDNLETRVEQRNEQAALEVQNLKERLAAVEDERNKLQSEVDNLVAQMSAPQDVGTESVISGGQEKWEKDRARMEAQMERYKKSIEEKNRRLVSLLRDVRKLKGQEQQIAEKTDEVQKTANEANREDEELIRQLRARIALLENERSRADVTLEQAGMNVEGADDQVASLSKQLNSLQAEKDALIQALAEEQAKSGSMGLELASLRSERDQLQEALNSMTASVEGRDAKIASIESSLTSMNDLQLAESQAQVVSLQGELAAMATELDVVRSERDSLVVKLAGRPTTVSDLEDKRRLSEMEKELATVTEQLHRAENEREKLFVQLQEKAAVGVSSEDSGRLKQLEAELAEMSRQLIAVQKERDQLALQLTDQSYAQSNTDSDTKIAALKSRVQELTDKNQELTRRLTVAEADDLDKKSLIDTKRALEERVSVLVAERDNLSKQYEELLADKEAERLSVASQNWDLEQATRRFNEAEREIDRLGRRLEQERALCEEEKKELEYLLFDPQITELEQVKRLEELEYTLRTAEEKFEVCENKMASLNAEMQTMQVAPSSVETFVRTPQAAVSQYEPETVQDVVMQDASPHQSLFFANVSDVKNMITTAGLALKGRIQRTQDTAFMKSFKWDTDGLFGSLEQRSSKDGVPFSQYISSYLDQTKNRCRGEFGAVEDDYTTGVKAYEIACIGERGDGATASVVFVETDQHYTAIAHETSLSNMDTAMDARDRVVNYIVSEAHK